MATSSRKISPLVSRSNPPSTCSSVLLPQPLGPMMETNSPAAMVRSIAIERMDGGTIGSRAAVELRRVLDANHGRAIFFTSDVKSSGLAPG